MAEDFVNKHVLLFKAPKEGGDPYEMELRQHGFIATSVPVLDFSFVNIEQLAALLKRVEDFAAVVFTSQRALEAVVRALDIVQGDDMSTERKAGSFGITCYVVGESTAQLAIKIGFSPKGENCGNVEKLSEFIVEDLKHRDKPILYPCGNLRKDTLSTKLKNAGLILEEIEVYRTGESSHIEEDVRNLMQKQGMPNFVVFFSPSGVQYTASLFSNGTIPLNDLKVVSIGPTTLQELNSRQIPVYSSAESPNPQGLVSALK